MKVKLMMTLLSVVAIQAGCVKKRPDMVSPVHTDPSQFREIPKGGDIDSFLNSVNDEAVAHIKGAKHQGHVILTGAQSTIGDLSDSSSVRISDDAGFDFPHYVDISTNAPLLAEHIEQIKMFGNPDQEYKIRYELTPKFLKIYKEIPADEITHYEMPYSKQMGGNKWWVPLGGYNVSYFTRKKQVNADNRNTNIVDFFAVPPESYKTATHYRFDKESFIVFDRVAKTNLFPFEYFTGEWYFATTIVSTRQGQESSMGYFDSSIDASLRAQATRIKFLRSKDFLRAVNTIVDERAQITDDQLTDALNIPAKWYDFRVKTDGQYESLAEENFPATDFSERKYVELDFKLVKALTDNKAETADYFSGLELSDMKFSKETFSFTVHTVASGIKRKYSFMRMKASDYKPRVYYKEDSKYFGLFKSQKFKLIDINSYGDGDIEKDTLINRFNPNKDIVFRFSNHTPNLQKGELDIYGLNIDYRKIGENATNYWNQVFKLVGAKSRVVVDTADDNELGDFEYNTINIITNLTDDGSGGVGPTIADPMTGEIINGTVNVYVATTIANLSRDINKALNLERDLIQDTIFSEEISKRPIMGGFIAEVRRFCPALVSYAHSTKKQIFNDSLADSPYINACLEQLAPKRIEAITVHEMGHTLGLRHNFYGSYDKNNSITSVNELKSLFPPSQFTDLYKYIPEDKFLGRTSSSMDYFMTWFSGDNGVVSVTPSYGDFYAIAYAYAGKVPIQGANKLAFKSISEDRDLSTQRAGMRPSLYCTDEQAMNRAQGVAVIDPACALHDYGQSYKEIIDYNFAKLRDDVVVGLKKIGRQHFTARGSVRSSALAGMSAVYANWRYNLRSFLKDPNDSTLINYNEQEFEALMERVKNSNSKIAQDVGISDLYYQYMMEVINMTNYYCVTKVKGTDEVNIREFNEVQERYINLSEDLTISSCMDDVVRTGLAADYNEEVITELGIPIQNIQYSKKLEDTVDTPDIVGVGGDRVNTATILAGINSKILRPTATVGLVASVLHEPKFYKDFKQKVISRVFEGVDVSDRVNYALKVAGSNLTVEPGRRFKRFKNETAIYSVQMNALLNSNIGSNGVSKTAELRDFNIMPAQHKAEIPGGTNHVKVGSVYYYTNAQNVFSNQILNRFKVMNYPLYTNLSYILPAGMQAYFEGVLDLVTGLPVEFENNNYVSQVSDVQILSNNIQRVSAENRNDQLATQEVMRAVQPYIPALNQIGVLSQAVDIGSRTSQSSVEMAMGEDKITINVAEARATLERLAANGFDAQMMQEFSLNIPISQFGLVSNYVAQKGANVHNMWLQGVRSNVNFVEDFEAIEATFYKQFLESTIKQMSTVTATR